MIRRAGMDRLDGAHGGSCRGVRLGGGRSQRRACRLRPLSLLRTTARATGRLRLPLSSLLGSAIKPQRCLRALASCSHQFFAHNEPTPVR
jgi:hypothetical protein